MIRAHWLGYALLGVLGLTVLLGCQQRPAVPTLAIEPTAASVVIVVTATSQPTLAPTIPPPATITPLPTLTGVATTTVTATLTAGPTSAATALPQATAPAVTAVVQPTADTAPPTTVAEPTVAAPSSFPAPSSLNPQGTAFRDGDTVFMEFTAAGPLAADQCYRIEMTLGNPTGPGGVGDYWVVLCGDQSAAGTPLTFPIKPGRFRDEPNYGTLLVSADEVIPPTPEYVMRWFVSLVRLTDASDPIHPATEALSPPGGSLENTWFR